MPSYLKLLQEIKTVKKRIYNAYNLYAVWLLDFLGRQFIVL